MAKDHRCRNFIISIRFNNLNVDTLNVLGRECNAAGYLETKLFFQSKLYFSTPCEPLVENATRVDKLVGIQFLTLKNIFLTLVNKQIPG